LLVLKLLPPVPSSEWNFRCPFSGIEVLLVAQRTANFLNVCVTLLTAWVKALNLVTAEAGCKSGLACFRGI